MHDVRHSMVPVISSRFGDGYVDQMFPGYGTQMFPGYGSQMIPGFS